LWPLVASFPERQDPEQAAGTSTWLLCLKKLLKPSHLAPIFRLVASFRRTNGSLEQPAKPDVINMLW